MYHISLLLASLAVSNLSDKSDLQFLLESMVPAVAYTLAALVIWLASNRRAIRRRRVSLRSFMFLLAVLSPGILLLRWVYWPWARP